MADHFGIINRSIAARRDQSIVRVDVSIVAAVSITRGNVSG